MQRWIIVTALVTLIALPVLHAEDAKKKPDLQEIWAQIQAAVKAGKLTQEQADAKMRAIKEGATKKRREKDFDAQLETLFRLVEKRELTAAQAMAKYRAMVDSSKKKGSRALTPEEVARLKQLDKTLPRTSTAGEEEGPASTFIFGWAANATHRFMDNSHRGKPRKIHGLSFRLDYRNHNAIGRTWENVTVRIAHGDFDSIQYNRSREFKLLDKSVKVFDRKWSFPTVKGFPPLKPASWGGPKNSLNFRFDEPFEYNGKDAIYVEFKFSGGKADDGREWKGELPFGFEYYLDSMPEVGGWRLVAKDGFEGPIYNKPPRVQAVTSYTAGGQSVWTSSPKGMPYIKWDFRK